MRKPEAMERVRCPEARSSKVHMPLKVWGENKKQIYGILGPHKHGMGSPECTYSYLAVKIEKTKN